MAVELRIETEETGEVLLLAVDGPFRLAGHLGPNVWLGERHQSALWVTCRRRYTLLFKMMCWDEGPRVASVLLDFRALSVTANQVVDDCKHRQFFQHTENCFAMQHIHMHRGLKLAQMSFDLQQVPYRATRSVAQ